MKRVSGGGVHFVELYALLAFGVSWVNSCLVATTSCDPGLVNLF